MYDAPGVTGGLAGRAAGAPAPWFECATETAAVWWRQLGHSVMCRNVCTSLGDWMGYLEGEWCSS